MTFRWFGPDDPIPLQHIRQIPGVTGIVTALYDVAIGDVWPKSSLERIGEQIDRAGLEFAVVESIADARGHQARTSDARPPARSILRERAAHGRARRARAVLQLHADLRLDAHRSREVQPDGSTALAYDDAALSRIDLSHGTGDLPGWATAYDAETLRALLDAYKHVDEEQLWENLAYFLERVAPEAESAGVKMAIHPDDPPWSIFGLPRIITSGAAFDRLIDLVDSPANGVTFCTGSLGADPANDLPGDGAHHRGAGPHPLHALPQRRHHGDAAVPRSAASVALRQRADARRAHRTAGHRIQGPMRPDHGRMIWGEVGRPGYGLHDRALGATYLQGFWEGLAPR